MSDNYVCIGYVPFFYVDPTRDIFKNSEQELSEFMRERLEHIPPIDPRICLFAHYKEQMTPVLVINKARDFIDHLLAYSRGQPEKYFNLVVDKYGDGYCLVMQPILDQAILRCREQQRGQGRYIPDDAVINVLMRHVAFFSPRLGAFEKLDRSKPLHVGFVDENDVDLSDAQVTPEPTFIGPLKVTDGTKMNIRHLFE